MIILEKYSELGKCPFVKAEYDILWEADYEDSLMASMGGNAYVFETAEDMVSEIAREYFGNFEKPDWFEQCVELGEYLFIININNNAGGPTAFIPMTLAMTNDKLKEFMLK
jgi:hypothetical protein